MVEQSNEWNRWENNFLPPASRYSKKSIIESPMSLSKEEYMIISNFSYNFRRAYIKPRRIDIKNFTAIPFERALIK